MLPSLGPKRITRRVLSVGVLSDIFSTRNAVLREAGFFVQPTLELSEALRLFGNAEFDAVVLCHRIPNGQKQDLIRQMKELKPLTPIITMTDGTGGPSGDVEVYNLDGPEALLQRLRAAVGGSGGAS
jgi:DNA-binding NtrC family response regulator